MTFWTSVLWKMFMAQNMCAIFSLVPSKKPVTRKKWEKLSVYFSIFEWWKLELYQKNHLALDNLTKLVFWWILSFKNWKINTYFFSVFSGGRCFWGDERKYFTHIPGLRSINQSYVIKSLPFCGSEFWRFSLLKI